MKSIELDRRFAPWEKNSSPAAEQWLPIYARYHLTWGDLLQRRRVVLLAEGGSGKTTELTRQANNFVVQGKPAFYATLQEVAREGLDNVLDRQGLERLTRWREGDGPAWFFIDSIDEAKLERIRFESAARKIADAIAGREGRAHIVLSGRPTEWEFERDGEALARILPLPVPEVPRPEVRTAIRRILNHEKAPPPPEKEEAHIVIMAPLDDAQVRQYATSLDVGDVDEFLTAIRRAHLEETVRRPLDLEWLVPYWIAKRRIGRFEAMVRQSLRERLKETNTDRRRYDRLVPETTMLGLERVGGAIVLARSNTIAIPDGGARATRGQDGLDINEVLKDWAGDDRAALVNRAVFDPVAGGRMRLHNDNEGVVSSYLAACWLRRLREANLSGRALHRLLFAHTYGVDLIRPAMRETAAWLSIWDEEVAREVVAREPALLFSAGDPASLPLSVRAGALLALTRRLIAGEIAHIRDTAGLTRFAQPDLVPTLRRLWDAHSDHIEVRSLVLKLIWFGALRECADIAASAAFGPFDDSRTAYLGAQALMAAGELGQRQAYAEHIKHNIASVPNDVLDCVVEELFPREVQIDDLVAFFEGGRLQGKDQGGTSLKWSASSLVARIADPGELERLIHGLLRLRAASAQEPERTLPGESDDTPEFMMAAAAERLLAISDDDSAPQAAVDAVLSFCERFGAPTGSTIEKLPEAIERLHASPLRRRAAFWRAAQTLPGVAGFGRPIATYFDMRHSGWNPGLRLEDLAWLLKDGPTRPELTEQQLAANAAIYLWGAHGNRSDVLSRIEEVAATCPAMRAEVNACLRPPTSSPAFQEHTRLMAEQAAEHKKQLEAQEDAWVAFLEDLRRAPDPLSALVPGAPGEVSMPLANLWQLLREMNRGKNRLAIDSVESLVPLAGAKVALAFAQAAHGVWRRRQPRPRSVRPDSERNMIGQWDPLALTGITLEAQDDSAWATRLSPAEAARATQYATLEINGLPTWIKDLVQARPDDVLEVLRTEVSYELDTRAEPMPGHLLDHIERASLEVISLMAAPLWQEVVSRESLGASDLESLLSIVRRGLDAATLQPAYTLAIARFTASEDPAVAAQYLGFAASIDPQGATQALDDKLATLNEADKTALVIPVLPQLFGSRMSFRSAPAINLDVATLLRLVIIANRAVRVEEDPDRTNGKVYSPGGRDNAQDSRGLAFNRLFDTPGRETFDALRTLKAEPAFASRAQHMESLALQRASLDSDLPVWEGDAVLIFEQRFEKEPTTGQELQLLALERLDDVQHDVLHSDFAQGATLSALPDEAAVQLWLADRLRLLQHRSYSVEREPETVASKKPDFVLTARADDAKVPIEIKVPESWSSRQLEEALRDQLCGQYLRDRNHREGILILVHQTRPDREWHPPGAKAMKFPELVDWLKARAKQIRDASGHGPQPEIAVIDVSSCAKADEATTSQPQGHKQAVLRKRRSRAMHGRRMRGKPSARRRRVVG
ncbi:hypothetical protein [Paraburkholderia youngii]|uniref:hypothetical protein n=1 Tax=Paraburkholderia youngii TaxID=2782701 RepID=UPI003D1F2A8D